MIIGVAVHGACSTNAVKALNKQTLGVQVGKAQGSGQMFHTLALTPTGHGVDERVDHLGIVDKVDVTEARLLFVVALVDQMIDDAGDASHDFLVAVSQEIGCLAEVKCRVLVRTQGVHFIGDQWRNVVLAVAVDDIDGETHKLEQVALGGLDFSEFNHILVFSCQFLVVS